MARARNIKPSFFLNDDLADCSIAARLLFVGLWTIADRRGRLHDKPRRIKAEVYPYDDVDVDALLCELADAGFIVRYTVDGERYVAIPTFEKHQNPHKNEKDSELPTPQEEPGVPSGGHVNECENGVVVSASSDNGLTQHGARTDEIGTSTVPIGLIPERGTLNPETTISSESSPAVDAAEPVQLTAFAFSVVGKGGGDWVLPKSLLDEFVAAYPAVDVEGQLRAAHAWLVANPTRRKTKRGMPQFLNGWLSRHQDSGRGKPRARVPPSETRVKDDIRDAEIARGKIYKALQRQLKRAPTEDEIRQHMEAPA